MQGDTKGKMPPLNNGFDKKTPQMPKSIKAIPRFLWEMVSGFFSRLFYIIAMVWRTGPWILISMIAISVLGGILPVVGSLISKEILNELQVVIESNAKGNEGMAFIGSAVMLLLVFFFVYKILNNVVTRLNSAVTRIAGEKVVRYVKVGIMEKAKELDLASFDRPEFYEKLENANREAGMRPIQVMSATFDVISKAISLISYVAVLISAPDMWWTAPLMVLVSIPTAVVNFTYRKKTFNYMRRRSKDRRQMNYYSDLMVDKNMVKEIRMYDLADTFRDEYNSVFARYYKGMRKLIVKENAWQLILTVLSSVINCVFFALIAVKVFRGEIQIGDYSLYTGALTSIATTVASLIGVSAQVYEGTLFIDNLISFMKEKPTVVPKSDKPLPIMSGQPHTIEFVNVSFAYPGTDKPVIKNLNVTLRPGETCVLVGLNGAGKTTFIKLLTRLYDPTEGHILLDGRDLREYDVRELYNMFGIIFQDFGKYAFSIADNIRFGDIHRELDKEAIKKAARDADADGFIEKLPMNYDTPLMRFFEESGTELSIGQWQKLSVARAFYSRSDILILDEPTASLDPLAEQEIFNQFDELRRDKTTIFVSHRLSSATVASKILVLEYGELIEEGTHRELMDKKGKYYELFTTQAKRYLEETEKDTSKND